MSELFYVGIPLIARAVAGDWPLVEHLFGLTLTSLLAQDDPDLRILLAAHDVPAPWARHAADPRFTFLQADWHPAPPTAANDDGGRKKWQIKAFVRAAGGGLLMFLDADDWVGRGLVGSARRAIGPDHVGAIVGGGMAIDYRSRRALPFPIPGVFDGDFHELCGSSTIARVIPDAVDPIGVDPHAVLGSHHEWSATAAARGARLARLDDVAGAYIVGTGENHSERDGPFAAWRLGITQAVRSAGIPVDDALLAQFGLAGVDLARSDLDQSTP